LGTWVLINESWYVHVFCAARDEEINLKKTHRIYKIGPSTAEQDAEAKSQGEAARRSSRSFALNDVWAIDFFHDQLATGQGIRVLPVVETFSRFSPAFNPRFSYRAEDVVATLGRSDGLTI
jgi:putative transposase